jgi:hypothetical protein
MEKIPIAYLSKRKDNTYSLIVNGTSVNQYTDKGACLRLAERFKTEDVKIVVWDCEAGKFQDE